MQIKHFSKFTAALFLLTTLLGCSTPKLIPEPSEVELSNDEYSSRPLLEVEAKVSVGENMYDEFSIKSIQSFRVNILDEATAEMDLGSTFTLPPGTSAPLKEVYRTKSKALCINGSAKSLTGIYDACLVDKANKGSFDYAMFKTRQKYFPLKKSVKYEIADVSERRSIRTPEFNCQVLYQGLSKGSIKISFREFLNGLARPAFTQDISYDLEKDGTAIIAFKNLRISVIKATQSEITYIVKKRLN